MDESWPTTGIQTSFYSRHKAEVERLLDRFEGEHPGVRVVRLRPGLIFKREAASGIRRLFAGPLLPGSLLRPGADPAGSSPRPAGLPGRALIRRRGGLPAGPGRRCARGLQHRRRPGARPCELGRRWALGRWRCPRGLRRAAAATFTCYACSRRSRAGSTWRSRRSGHGCRAGARAARLESAALLGGGAARPARGHARGRGAGDAAPRSRAAPVRCGHASSSAGSAPGLARPLRDRAPPPRPRLSAVGAAEHRRAGLDAVADDLAAAVVAHGAIRWMAHSKLSKTWVSPPP